MKRIIKFIFLTICLCIFTYSAYNIYKYIEEENANKKLNNKLIEKAITNITTVNSDKQEKNEYNLPIKVDFTILKQENKDIVGWIYSPNTPINYPVMQGKDNEYYLSRLSNENYNIAGSIFMDFRNDPYLQDNNTIIYGHNMKNDTMFGSIQEYKNQEYYNNHKIIYYFTPNKSYILELFADQTIQVESDIYDLTIINDTKIQELIKNSDFKSDVLVNEKDKLLTLSTCSEENDKARYIVIGVLHEV